jgi:hypothetical protein
MTPRASQDAWRARTASLANRMRTLRRENDQERGIYSFTLAALYAVSKALDLGVSRRRTSRLPDEEPILAQLEEGRVPCSGNWLAGYYYNDALLRVDIAFEAIARRRSGLAGDEDIKRLIAEADRHGLNRKFLSRWPDVRREVNAMKHRNPEQIKRHRRVPKGLDEGERLLSAVEALAGAATHALPAQRHGDPQRHPPAGTLLRG